MSFRRSDLLMLSVECRLEADSSPAGSSLKCRQSDDGTILHQEEDVEESENDNKFLSWSFLFYYLVRLNQKI